MSGFQFPPPPPPPPVQSKTNEAHRIPQESESSHGRGRGRGRGDVRGGRASINQRQFHDQRHVHGGDTDPVSSANRSCPPRERIYEARFSANFHPDDMKSEGVYTQSRYDNRAHRGDYTKPRHDIASSIPAAETLPRTMAGHKRKLEVLRGPVTKIPPDITPAAPLIPSFGGPILPRASNINRIPAQVASNATQKQAPSIGLVPRIGGILYSSDSEDNDDDDADIDEESTYAALGSTLTFEHNGTVINLESTADLFTWKEERKKNFPTQARLVSKLEMKRQIGELRKILITGAREMLSNPRKPLAGQSSSFPTPARLEEAFGIESVPGQEGTDGSFDQTAHNNNDAAIIPGLGTNASIIAGSVPTSRSFDNQSPGPGSAERDEGSDTRPVRAAGDPSLSGEIAENSENEAPEQLSSKPSAANATTHLRPCRYFAAAGRCKDGNTCRFFHDLTSLQPPDSNNPGRKQQQARSNHQDATQNHAVSTQSKKTIHQRLVEQEQAEEDRLILQAIKNLGQAALFA